MASQSEQSFGARLRRAQDLLTYMQGFTGYAPPRTQESVAGFTTLLSSIVANNNTAASNREQYKIAVDQRQLTFNGTSGSVNKLLVPIKGAVVAQYGSNSTEALSLAALIKDMRATKLIKPPTADNAGNESTGETTAVSTSISQSERSYGSMTQHFNDIIATLGQFTGYNPSNASIKLAGLQTLSTQLTTLNNAVAQKTQALQTARSARNTQYEDLQDRVLRIKSYVRAQYGSTSNEYKLIKGLKI